jgi:hypothetical protein
MTTSIHTAAQKLAAHYHLSDTDRIGVSSNHIMRFRFVKPISPFFDKVTTYQYILSSMEG